MEWILLMQIMATTMCDRLLVEGRECYEHVLECTLDGEKPDWCLYDFMEGKGE